MTITTTKCEEGGHPEEKRFIQFLLSDVPRDYRLITEYSVVDRLADLETLLELFKCNKIVGNGSPILCLLNQMIRCYIRWLNNIRGKAYKNPGAMDKDDTGQIFNDLNKLIMEKRRQLNNVQELEEVYGDSINWIQEKLCNYLAFLPTTHSDVNRNEKPGWKPFDCRNKIDSIKYILNIADMVLVDVPKMRGWGGDKVIFFFQKFLLKPFSICVKDKKNRFLIDPDFNLSETIALCRAKLSLMVLLIYKMISPLEPSFRIFKALLGSLEITLNTPVLPQIYETDEDFLLEKYCYLYECLAHILPILKRKNNKKLTNFVGVTATPLIRKLYGIYNLIVKKWEVSAGREKREAKKNLVESFAEYSYQTNWSLHHEMCLLYRVVFKNKNTASKLLAKFPKDFLVWKRDIKVSFRGVVVSFKETQMGCSDEFKYLLDGVMNVCNLVIFYQSLLAMEVFFPWDPIMTHVVEICWKRISQLSVLDPHPPTNVDESHHKKFMANLKELQDHSDRGPKDSRRSKIKKVMSTTLSLAISILNNCQASPVVSKKNFSQYQNCSFSELKYIVDLFKLLQEKTEISVDSLSQEAKRNIDEVLEMINKKRKGEESEPYTARNITTLSYRASSISCTAPSNFMG